MSLAFSYEFLTPLITSVLFLICFSATTSHQTVLYVTLRVAKDELTPEKLKVELDRLAPRSTRLEGDEIPLTQDSEFAETTSNNE